MNYSPSFIRKVVYIAVMAVLLLPLAYLGQPAGYDVQEPSGGLLERERREHKLSETSLGEIDPASETMKLATLGMSGVATTLLWNEANKAKMKENWEGFAASLNQISKLQPHFVSVWVFQAWNMSYNVSVEFDDYRYRYHWVKKGIDYLMEGIRYNQQKPKLYWHLGWSFGQKIGRSDERVQFRQLFHDDKDYHATLPIDFDNPNVEVRDYNFRIDNWLVGREFLLRGQRLADLHNIEELGQSKVVFHSEPTMFRINYAETIEEEGFFGDHASDAWRNASKEWDEFGDRRLKYTQDDILFTLNELETVEARAEELRKNFEEQYAELREEILAEKRELLSEEELEAYDTPEEARTTEEGYRAEQAKRKLHIGHREIAQRVPASEREEADRTAEQLSDLERRASIIASYRGIVNFEFWRTRALSEQQPEMLAARKSLYDANRLYDEARLTESKAEYEKAWDNWAIMYERFPSLLDKDPDTEDLVEHIDRYRELLGQLEEELPPDFKLQAVLDLYDRQRGRSQSRPKDGSGPTGQGETTETPDEEPADTEKDNDSDMESSETPEESTSPDSEENNSTADPAERTDSESGDGENPRNAIPKPPVPSDQ